MVIQYIGAEQYRTYSTFFPLKIKESKSVLCECPNVGANSVNVAEIKDNYILTNFDTGKIYLSYQGAMEDTEGNLLVLDHPYCNEYYEYALKQRILEQKLRASRNNALGFVNTPDFAEMKKIWEVNRKAQYHNYYDMFKSRPTFY